MSIVSNDKVFPFTKVSNDLQDFFRTLAVFDLFIGDGMNCSGLGETSGSWTLERPIAYVKGVASLLRSRGLWFVFHGVAMRTTDEIPRNNWLVSLRRAFVTVTRSRHRTERRIGGENNQTSVSREPALDQIR